MHALQARGRHWGQEATAALLTIVGLAKPSRLFNAFLEPSSVKWDRYALILNDMVPPGGWEAPDQGNFTGEECRNRYKKLEMQRSRIRNAVAQSINLTGTATAEMVRAPHAFAWAEFVSSSFFLNQVNVM